MRGRGAFPSSAVIAGGAALATWMFAAVSGAQEKPPKLVVLDFQAGPGTESCISEEQLKEAVEAQLERGVFTFAGEETPETTRIRIRIEKAKDGNFRAVASLEEPEGPSETGQAPLDRSERELQSAGPDCRTLDQSLALVVSVMAAGDIMDAAEPSESNAGTAPPAAARKEREHDQSSEPILTVHEPEHVPSKPWQFTVDGSASVAVGLLPEVDFGAEVGATALPPSLPALWMHIAGWLPEQEDLPENASVTFTMAKVGAALCPALYSGPVMMLLGCLGGDLGILRARSSGLAGSRTRTAFMGLVDATLRSTVQWAAHWQAVAALSALFPTNPDRFVYELPDGREQVIHRVKPVSVTAALGIGLTFR